MEERIHIKACLFDLDGVLSKASGLSHADIVKSCNDAIKEAKEEKDYIGGYELDVDRLVFGEILISMPGKTLCTPDCKGLCSICGHNLNVSECGCDRESLDPRMSVFKDILKNFKEV